ncbi:LysR family transcriptional regulator [Brucellaceae bacterium D45D]
MRRRKSTIPTEISRQLSARIPMVALIQLLSVAEHLSFHRAAQAIGTSQSSVSARIKALEEELGIIIFDRTTRGVRLTNTGRVFVEQVSEAVGILDHAVKLVGAHVLGHTGGLRVGIYALTVGSFLYNLLERFREEHANVHLQITEGTARAAHLMLREDRLDVAFMAGDFRLNDLNSRVLWQDRLMVVLPAHHQLNEKSEIEWPRLSEEIFLVRRNGSGPQVRNLIVARIAPTWTIPEIRLLDVGRSGLLSLVASGHGISIATEESAQLGITNLSFVPIASEQGMVPFSAVWSPRNSNPSLKKFLSLAFRAARWRSSGT